MHQKKQFIRRMYDTLAARYDVTNSAISLRQDQRWRRAVARRMPRHGRIADLGAGTGVLTEQYAKSSRGDAQVVLVDFNREMLSRARQRLTRTHPDLPVSYVIADVEHLPFKDGAFTGCMSAFVLRNLPSVSAIVPESYRVLAPNGTAAFLDATRPPAGIWQRLFDLYFQHLMPVLSRVFNPGEREAYRYLAGSVIDFPRVGEVLAAFQAAGFLQPRLVSMWGGILSIFMARKVPSAE